MHKPSLSRHTVLRLKEGLCIVLHLYGCTLITTQTLNHHLLEAWINLWICDVKKWWLCNITYVICKASSVTADDTVWPTTEIEKRKWSWQGCQFRLLLTVSYTVLIRQFTVTNIEVTLFLFDNSLLQILNYIARIHIPMSLWLTKEIGVIMCSILLFGTTCNNGSSHW